MFLSKITFTNTFDARKQLIKVLEKGVYASHQLMWQMFPGQPEKKRDYLFREEVVNGNTQFYMLSVEPPSQQQSIFNVQTKPFHPVLFEGMELGFRLMANPTVSRKLKPEDKRGKRVDVMMDCKKRLQAEGESDRKVINQQMDLAAKAWLMNEKRQAEIGVEFNVAPEIISVHQHKTQGKQNIQFTAVDYQGVLTIKDPAKFQQALAHGIGRSKAFGCGLMMIKRI